VALLPVGIDGPIEFLSGFPPVINDHLKTLLLVAQHQMKILCGSSGRRIGSVIPRDGRHGSQINSYRR